MAIEAQRASQQQEDQKCLPLLPQGIILESVAREALRIGRHEQQFGGYETTGNTYLSQAIEAGTLDSTKVISEATIEQQLQEIGPNEKFADLAWNTPLAKAQRKIFLSSIADPGKQAALEEKFSSLSDNLSATKVYFYVCVDFNNRKEDDEAVGTGYWLQHHTDQPILSVHAQYDRALAAEVMASEVAQLEEARHHLETPTVTSAQEAFLRIPWKVRTDQYDPNSVHVQELISQVPQEQGLELRSWFDLQHQLLQAQQQLVDARFLPDSETKQQIIRQAKMDKLRIYALNNNFPVPEEMVGTTILDGTQSNDRTAQLIALCNEKNDTKVQQAAADQQSTRQWIKKVAEQTSKSPKEALRGAMGFIDKDVLFDIPTSHVVLPSADQLATLYADCGHPEEMQAMVRKIVQEIESNPEIEANFANFLHLLNGVSKLQAAHTAYGEDMPFVATVSLDDIFDQTGVSSQSFQALDADTHQLWQQLDGPQVKTTLHLASPLADNRNLTLRSGSEEHRSFSTVTDRAIAACATIPYGKMEQLRVAGTTVNRLDYVIIGNTGPTIMRVDNYENPTGTGTMEMIRFMAQTNPNVYLFTPQHRTWGPDYRSTPPTRKCEVNSDLILGATGGLHHIQVHLNHHRINLPSFYQEVFRLAGQPGLDNNCGVGLVSPRGAAVGSLPYETAANLGSQPQVAKSLDHFLQTPHLNEPETAQMVGSFGHEMQTITRDQAQHLIRRLTDPTTEEETIYEILADETVVTPQIALRFRSINDIIWTMQQSQHAVTQQHQELEEDIRQHEAIVTYCRAPETAAEQSTVALLSRRYGLEDQPQTMAAALAAIDALLDSGSNRAPLEKIKRDNTTAIQRLRAEQREREAVAECLRIQLEGKPATKPRGGGPEEPAQPGRLQIREAMKTQLLIDLGKRSLDLRFAQAPLQLTDPVVYSMKK